MTSPEDDMQAFSDAGVKVLGVDHEIARIHACRRGDWLFFGGAAGILLTELLHANGWVAGAIMLAAGWSYNEVERKRIKKAAEANLARHLAGE